MANEIPVTRFYQGDRRRGQWGFYGDRSRPDGIKARELVGETVNVGTKDGLVYDSARVTEFDDHGGYLTLQGGQHQSFSGPLRDTGEVRVPIWEIARGYIHLQNEPEEHAVIPQSNNTIRIRKLPRRPRLCDTGFLAKLSVTAQPRPKGRS